MPSVETLWKWGSEWERECVCVCVCVCEWMSEWESEGVNERERERERERCPRIKEWVGKGGNVKIWIRCCALWLFCFTLIFTIKKTRYIACCFPKITSFNLWKSNKQIWVLWLNIKMKKSHCPAPMVVMTKEYWVMMNGVVWLNNDEEKNNKIQESDFKMWGRAQRMIVRL